MAEAFLNEDLPEAVFGAPKAGSGMWASIIRVMDPVEGKTDHLIRLEQNEAALSLCLIKFIHHPVDEQFLVVGVVKDMQLSPRQVTEGFLYTYR